MDGIKQGILKGFLELDEKLRRIPEVASGEDKSGTTAVCALITQKYLIIANCGDSRGVCCTEGKPVLATQVRSSSQGTTTFIRLTFTGKFKRFGSSGDKILLLR